MDLTLCAMTSILQQQMQFMADACHESWKRFNPIDIFLHERMHVSYVSGYINSLYISYTMNVLCVYDCWWMTWRQGKIGCAINIPLMRIKNDSVNLAIIFAIERQQEAQPIRKTKKKKIKWHFVYNCLAGTQNARMKSFGNEWMWWQWTAFQVLAGRRKNGNSWIQKWNLIFKLLWMKHEFREHFKFINDAKLLQ